MSLQFTLIYRTSKFAESKILDFETRNVFKKHKTHAQYMTQRKMKVLAKADALYNSLLPIHQQLAHSNFVIFVMPTEDANYTKLEQIETLISDLKKEQLVQNEEFYFVALVYNGVCINQEQLQKIISFNNDTNANKALHQTLKNPTAVLNYTIHKNITPLVLQYNYVEKTITTLSQSQQLYI